MVNHWPIWIEYAVPLFPNGVLCDFMQLSSNSDGSISERRIHYASYRGSLSKCHRFAFCLVKRSFRETKLLLPANFHRLDSLHLRAIFQSTNFHPRFPSRLKARNIARSIFFSDIRFFLKKEKKRKRD